LITFDTYQNNRNMSLKATSINLFSFKTVQMKAFHITWMTFFLCFFGWFGLAPLMPVIKKEFNLTAGQIANINIAAVSITILARLFIGWVCDKIGPRLAYTILLAAGSLPVMLIGFASSYESFLLCRLAIGFIGASFVITQYHTSVMFDPKIVGTANATVAGWGNLGGGITQMVMPLIFAAIISFGFTEGEAWRMAMIIPGAALLVMAFVYYNFTQDTPDGNVLELRKTNAEYKAKNADAKGSFLTAAKDYRVWILFLVYGSCFGIEIMMDGIAALYFTETFDLALTHAGIIAMLFGAMNLFARALGGIFSDKAAGKYGIKGRVWLLGSFLFLEGLGIMLFSQMTVLFLAITSMIAFALFVKMSNGVTYSIVPFVNKKALGAVSGIVGAGGNVGAVAANFVFKSYSYSDGLVMIGMTVSSVALLAFFLKFKNEKEESLKTIAEKKMAVYTSEKDLIMQEA
jgi:NNP family nitrate/nitrite transporter-like MFS transporter